MYRPLAIALFGVAVFTSPLSAQMRVAGAIAAAPPQAANPPAGHGSVTVHFGEPRSAHRFGPRTILFPTPYFYPYYDDYAREPEAPTPQVVVMQSPPAAPAPEASAPAPEPLLLEWQGDHWVRITNYGQPATRPQLDHSGESNLRSTPGRKSPLQPPAELAPAVLVFRDGRKEEVSSYTIVSGTMYTKADYWTSGSWTKKIQIADLDVPATLRLNQERGVKFALPAGPHEVVIRP
jgi:hypothetical protein